MIATPKSTVAHLPPLSDKALQALYRFMLPGYHLYRHGKRFYMLSEESQQEAVKRPDKRTARSVDPGCASVRPRDVEALLERGWITSPQVITPLISEYSLTEEGRQYIRDNQLYRQLTLDILLNPE